MTIEEQRREVLRLLELQAKYLAHINLKMFMIWSTLLLILGVLTAISFND
jgi:hypothetical protein